MIANELNSCTDTTRDKHLELETAIDEMKYLLNQANDLRDRINPIPKEESTEGVDKSPPRAPPSLLEVLTDGPQRIQSKREEISQVLAEINDRLFGNKGD